MQQGDKVIIQYFNDEYIVEDWGLATVSGLHRHLPDSEVCCEFYYSTPFHGYIGGCRPMSYFIPVDGIAKWELLGGIGAFEIRVPRYII